MGVSPGIVADSLGWALLHSIWQISLIAILVFAALRIIPRRNAQLRFLAAYGGLVASLLMFVVTWVVSYRTIAAVQPIAATYLVPARGWDAVIETLGQTTIMISSLWAMGVGWLGVRYFQALRDTARLKSEGAGPVPAEWDMRFRLWVERLGADSRTAILQSTRITTPLTIGVLKPVVLVPTGFFLRLPMDQAEAVLIHEIAHICRQDYLLGLVQAIICNIFFFHPAIAYLCRQIDIEREYACDARVVRETGNTNALAQGLSKVALESRDMLPGFAMAADGGRTPLMNRIARLREQPFHRESAAAMPIAALTLVLAGCLTITASADASFSSGAAGKANRDDSATKEQTATVTSRSNAAATSDGVKGTDSPARVARRAPSMQDTLPDVQHSADDRWASAGAQAWGSELRQNWAFEFENYGDYARKSADTAVRRVSSELDGGFLENAMVRAALFEVDIPAITEEEEAECDEKHDMAERRRDREEIHREREIANLEDRAERQELAIEHDIERVVARIEQDIAHLEQRMERMNEQRAARFEREMTELSEQLDALVTELESRIERRWERNEARIRPIDRRHGNSRPHTVPEPPEPPMPTITISFRIERLYDRHTAGAIHFAALTSAPTG